MVEMAASSRGSGRRARTIVFSGDVGVGRDADSDRIRRVPALCECLLMSSIDLLATGLHDHTHSHPGISSSPRPPRNLRTSRGVVLLVRPRRRTRRAAAVILLLGDMMQAGRSRRCRSHLTARQWPVDAQHLRQPPAPTTILARGSRSLVGWDHQPACPRALPLPSASGGIAAPSTIFPARASHHLETSRMMIRRSGADTNLGRA